MSERKHGPFGLWDFPVLNSFLESRGGRGRFQTQFRYPKLPEVCYCPKCGYRVENPRKHCPELGSCPVCGAPRLWRAK